MKKVLIVCPYPHGRAPSQRFRFEQYLDVDGVEFTQVSFWKDDEWPAIYKDGSITYKVLRTIGGFWRRLLLLAQVRNFDKVFVHREATPIGPPWFEWAVTKIFKKPLIFDFDDAIWLPNSSKANEKLAGKLKFHGKTAKICSWATTVVAGNDFLADYGKQYCTDVRIIPTTIDTENHHNPDLYEKVGSKRRKKQAEHGESAVNEHPDSYRDNPDLYEKVGSKWKRKNEKEQAEDRRPQADHDNSDNLQNEDGSVSPSLEGVAPTTGGDGGGESVAKRSDQEFTESSSTDKQLTANSQRLTANPNAIDPSSEAHPNTQYSIRNTIPTIGWTGTHSTLKQLTPLFPLLEEIHKKHPFRFLLIADIPPESMPDFVEFRKWKKETEIEDLLEMDIGVMPLYDTDWERGKCGFKALQYMALGRPVVVSQVGVNASIVQEGINGFLCEPAPFERHSKWADSLRQLLEDIDLRNELGLVGREHIHDNYSIQSQSNNYYNLLNS